MDADHYKALGLVGQIMAFETLTLLMKKGVITGHEMIEVIDRCLLNLETQTARAEDEDAVPFALARAICETALASLGGPGQPPPREST